MGVLPGAFFEHRLNGLCGEVRRLELSMRSHRDLGGG